MEKRDFRKSKNKSYPVGLGGMPIGSPYYPDSTFRNYSNSTDSVSYGRINTADDLGLSYDEVSDKMKG